MKRKFKYPVLFITLCLQFLTTDIKAQTPFGYVPPEMDKYDIMDSAYTKISYKLYFIPDLKKKNTIVRNDLVLLIGSRISKFYSMEIITPEMAERKKNLPPDFRLMDDGRGLAATEVFKDLINQNILVTTKVDATSTVYTYTENTPAITWTLINENKVINNYPCKKATTTFRGREWVAWYAPTIPINNGPWKFSGLPGLILNICDSTNSYVFECTGFKNLEPKESIKKYKWEYEQMSRKELYSLLKSKHEDFKQSMVLMGKKIIDDVSSEKVISIPYNPIELN